MRSFILIIATLITSSICMANEDSDQIVLDLSKDKVRMECDDYRVRKDIRKFLRENKVSEYIITENGAVEITAENENILIVVPGACNIRVKLGKE